MKIESIIITILLLSTQIAIQITEENNTTPIQSIHKVRVLSTLASNVLDKKITNDDVLNNKSLNFEKTISNGDIVEISSSDWVSSKTHNNT